MARWATGIPPSKEGRYLVTIETPWGRQVRQADRYNNYGSVWSWSVLPSYGSDKIVAWQKCPEPYKG